MSSQVFRKKNNRVSATWTPSDGKHQPKQHSSTKIWKLPQKGFHSIKKNFMGAGRKQPLQKPFEESVTSALSLEQSQHSNESTISSTETFRGTPRQRFKSNFSNRAVPIAKWSRKLYGSDKAVEDEHLKVIQVGSFVIHPFSNFRFVWDVFSSIIIIINIVIIPMDIAFSPEKSSSAVTIIKLLSDVWFLVDILLNFRTGITISQDDNTSIELEPKIIQRRYLKSWFLLDFVAAFPIDFIVTFAVDRSSTTISTDLLGLLRIAKVLSLVRIARIPRLLRGLHKWEEIFNLQYDMAISFLRFSNLIFILFLATHWNGCLQYMIPMFYGFPETTWVKIRGLDQPNITWGEAYSWSLFKSTSHMLCIGFSKVIPRGLVDLWTTMLSQVSGAVLFGIFISNAINLMEEMDVSKNAYNGKIAQIREYLAFRRIALPMRRKILDYFDIRYGGKLFDEEQILSELSPGLRREVIWHNTAVLIQSVPIFDDVSDDFVTDLGAKLFFTVFTPEDWLVKEGTKAFHMFFIQRGIAIVCFQDGTFIRQLSDGMHFGETCLLHKDLERAASVQALTNVFTFTLHRNDFLQVIQHHPQDKLKIQTRFHNLKQRTSLYNYCSNDDQQRAPHLNLSAMS